MNPTTQTDCPGDDSTRSLFDQATAALLVYDVNLGHIIEANLAAAQLFECALADLIGWGPEVFHTVGDEPMDDTRQRINEMTRLVLAGREFQRTVWVRTAKGSKRCCEMKLVSLSAAGRELVGANYIDVTDRSDKQATQVANKYEMAELAQHRQAILDNVMEGIITADADGCIQSFNRAATDIFGYTAEEVIGQKLSILMPQPDRAQHDGYVSRYEATRKASIVGVGRETSGQHKSGRVFPIHLSVSVIERQGRPTYIGLVRDISAQKEAESHIERLVYYDALTGLPNRRLLIDRISQKQKKLARQGGHAALIFADIDKFKSVNDTLGHAAGDALLCSAGKRFAECIDGHGTVARLGGDEFALLIGGLDPDSDKAFAEATIWCQTLLQLTRQQHRLFGHEHRTSASLGVLLFRDGRESPEALLAQADHAMYQAKAESRDTFRFYDAEMARTTALRATLLNDLRLALPRRELMLMYQPQVDAHGRLLGAEALVRWRHPTRGLVSPADFIPLAEQSGFIVEIGAWVLRQACDTLAQWQNNPQTAMLTIAVNISATEFRDPNFVDAVSRTLAASGTDPQRLKLELTESVLTVDLAELSTKLRILKRMGVGLSLDDFGTGYSSIAYLRELPMDQLKIDRSFIVGIETSPRDEAIVRGIVHLCKVLHLTAIAEGVETEGQREKLLACGCSSFQGYLTGRPMNAEDLCVVTEAVTVEPT